MATTGKKAQMKRQPNAAGPQKDPDRKKITTRKKDREIDPERRLSEEEAEEFAWMPGKTSRYSDEEG